MPSKLEKRKRKARPALPPYENLGPHQKIVPGVALIHLKLIGRVVIQWNYLEHELQDFVWRMLHLSFSDGRTITSRMDTGRIIEVLFALTPRHVPEPQRDQFLDLLVDADALRNDRNAICHGIWSKLEPDNAHIVTSFRGTDEEDEMLAQEFTEERMREIISDIKRVRRLMDQTMNEHFPSPNRG